MHTLKSAALVALLAASASVVRAQTFAYTPGMAKYRITQKMSQTQEMMGQKKTDSLSSVQLLSLDLAAKGKDSLAFTLTIDSTTTSMAPAQAELAKLNGKKVTGAMSSLGKVASFVAPVDSASPTKGQEFESLRNFMLRFPDRNPKVGTSWVDTTNTPINNQGITGHATIIITSKIVGDTTVAGQKAWRVQRTGTTAVSGAGTQNGQALVLEGKGTLNGMSYVGANGVYLGANSTQNQEMSIQLPAMGMTVPITQTVSTMVEMVGPKK
ncbi:MAG: hypothetical protein WKG32_09205 [Gemmatimonadaceae bacterium]